MSRRRPSGKHARGIAGRACLLPVVAVLLVLVPAGNGGVAVTGQLFKPPFQGSGITVGAWTLYGCGGSARWSALPTFNLTNGHARGVTHVSASPCNNGATQYNVVMLVGETGLLGANFTGTGKPQHVHVSWLVSFLEQFHLRNGTNQTLISGYVNFTVAAFVTDPTGVTVLASSPIWTDLHFLKGNLSYSVVRQTIGFSFNVTLTAGGAYSVLAVLILEINLTTPLSGSGQLDGRVAFGSAGHPCRLNSIRIR